MSESRRDRPARPAIRVIVQLLGFAASIALLYWCVQRALSGDRTTQLERLRQASPALVASILAMAAASVVINGLTFWIAARRRHRVSVLGVQATNALATMLSYLPFKLGLLSRIVIHNQRDRIPLFSIGGWFAAVTALMFLAPVPIVLASLIRPSPDAVWWTMAIAGVLVVGVCIVLVSRIFAGAKGLDRISGMVTWSRRLGRIVKSEAFGRLHGGLDMLADPRVVAPSLALWLSDYGLRALRFVIAAQILAVSMPFGQAVILGSTYFIIGVLSPFGMVGTREAGTAGIAALLAIHQSSEAASVLLLVGAGEVLSNIALGIVGAIYVRLHRPKATIEAEPISPASE
ncbi:MAG: flippase-like domain-containing protein [Phycisphaeraceae bacterium]|nr:flippase-like domain-containing protein [Phycisphaeraceae bacterium]